MLYEEVVSELGEDAEQLEQLYRSALKAGEGDAFGQAIAAGHAAEPDNLLYAAWYHRLRMTVEEVRASFVNWAWVVPLAVLNGLLFWWLSDDQRYMIEIAGSPGRPGTEIVPTLLVLAAPIIAVFVLIYLTVNGRRDWRLSAIIGGMLLAAAAYVLWAYPQTGTRPFQTQYVNLMLLHLPLLAWAGVALYLTAPNPDAENRFAFLIKSLEVIVLGGLFVIAGGLFTAITIGLFDALGVTLPVVVQRLIIAGGAGLIPVTAVAVLYNPGRPPAGQAFDEGLSKLVALLMRALLPLTFIVLVVYLAFIPFNFRVPFENRDVLVVYNAMLFAVIALLVGVTPLSMAGLSPQLARWLRRGIIAVAVLALLVSLYALAAIVYRTGIYRLTPNRLAFVGWNVINIGLLIWVLLYQAQAAGGNWVGALHRAFSAGTVAYAAWTLAVILAVPWLFGVDEQAVEALPPAVQEIVYEYPDPILLKCHRSPHIYLLDGGDKRWIDTIETFEAQGFVWSDVRFVSCADLRSIPDGVPIPANAGPPPQP